MPLALLPASAAAFAPRSAPNIVLSSRVEQWLTQTLKRINRIKRPLNSVPQHYRCLCETLSGPSAIWTLASLMLPRAPNADLLKDDNILIEAIKNYQIVHVEAYVVHIDMVSQNEIAYKLNQETIENLIEYHKEIYSVDIAAGTWDWPEKEQQLKKLQDDFAQAINRFVYRTHVRALEGLEDDGAGELLEGRSGEVKNQIMNLFLPLLPPPPKVQQEIVQQHYAMPMSTSSDDFWHHMPSDTSPMSFVPADPWRVLGSSPSPTPTTGDSISSAWSNTSFPSSQITSPSSPYGQPYEIAAPTSTPTSLPFTSSGSYYGYTQTSSPSTSVPLPSTLAQQCGPRSMGPSYGGFPWTDTLQTPIPI